MRKSSLFHALNKKQDNERSIRSYLLHSRAFLCRAGAPLNENNNACIFYIFMLKLNVFDPENHYYSASKQNLYL